MAQNNVQIIKISIAQERGKILGEATHGLANFFGYNQKEFGQIKSINQLMPSFISSVHNLLINNMISRGISQYMRKRKQTFAQNEQGFLIPINIYIDHYHEVRNDFWMYGAVLKLKTPSQYIIFDSVGQIQGITKKIFFQIFKERLNKNYYTNSIKQQTHFRKEIKNEIVNLNKVLHYLNVYILMPQLAQSIEETISQSFNDQNQKDFKQPQMIKKYILTLFQRNIMNQEHYGTLSFPTKAFYLQQLLNCTPQNNTKSQTDLKNNSSKFIYSNSVNNILGNISTMNSTQVRRQSYKEFEQFYMQNQQEWFKDGLYSALNIKYSLEIRELNYCDNTTQQNYIYYVMEILDSEDISSEQEDTESINIRNLDQADIQMNSTLVDFEIFHENKRLNNQENQRQTSKTVKHTNYNVFQPQSEDIQTPKHFEKTFQNYQFPSSFFKRSSVTNGLISMDNDFNQQLSFQNKNNQTFQNNTIIKNEKNKLLSIDSPVNISHQMLSFDKINIDFNNQHNDPNGSVENHFYMDAVGTKYDIIAIAKSANILTPTASSGVLFSEKYLDQTKSPHQGQEEIVSDAFISQIELQTDNKNPNIKKQYNNQQVSKSKFNKQQTDNQNIFMQEDSSVQNQQQSEITNNKTQEQKQKRKNKLMQTKKMKTQQKDIDQKYTQSYYSSSSSFKSLSNHLLIQIMGRTNTKYCKTVQIFSVLYLLSFTFMSFIIGFAILININDISKEIESTYKYSNYYPLIANQTLNAINIYSIQNQIISDSNNELQKQLYSSCQEMRELYLKQFEERFNILVKVSPNEKTFTYDVVTFANKQFQFYFSKQSNPFL